MANFESVVQWVLYQEDDHHNPGIIKALRDGAGLTRLGITSRYHGSDVPPTFWSTMPFKEAVVAAKQVYKNFFWNPIHGDQIPYDGVAACIFSFAVNENPRTAVETLQNVLEVKADGVLGPATLAELTQKDPQIVEKLYRASWIDWYHMDANRNPSKAGFLNGWINRANFPYPSSEVPNIYAS